MRVRMLVAISGGRPDGSNWPAVGEIIEVSDEEGEALTRIDPHHDTAMALKVDGEETETRAPEPEAEVAEPAAEAAEVSAPAEEPVTTRRAGRAKTRE